MAAELTEAFPGIEVQLISGSGGIFEVSVNGAPVFSKKRVGRHALSGEVVELVRATHSGGS